MRNLRIKLLNDRAVVPTRAHEGDAGLDLYSSEDVSFRPGEVVAVPTGIALEIPLGYVGLVHPRSGLASRQGITVVNAPGTIDAAYRGEVLVLLTSIKQQGLITLPAGSRIAQLVIQQVELPEIEVVDELSDSVRGENGFGSTGV